MSLNFDSVNYKPYYVLYEQDTPINFINSEEFNGLYEFEKNIKTKVTESINIIKTTELKKWYKNPKNILINNPFSLQYNDLYFSRYSSNDYLNDIHKYVVISYIPGKFPEIFQNETYKIVWFIDVYKYHDILFEQEYHKLYFKSFTIYSYTRSKITIDPVNFADLENDYEYKYDKNELDKFNKHFIDFGFNTDNNKEFYVIFNNNTEDKYKITFYIYQLLKYIDINRYFNNKLPKDLINYVKDFITFQISVALTDLPYNIHHENLELFKNPHNKILDLSTLRLEELINNQNINDLVSEELNKPLYVIDGITGIDQETFDNFSWMLKRYVLKISY